MCAPPVWTTTNCHYHLSQSEDNFFKYSKSVPMTSALFGTMVLGPTSSGELRLNSADPFSDPDVSFNYMSTARPGG